MIDKRNHILSVTEQIIADKGYQHLSMAKLASVANVASGTIYRYFKDKQHLIDAVAEHCIARYCEQATQNVDMKTVNYNTFKQLWRNLLKLNCQQSEGQISTEQFNSLPISDKQKMNALREINFERFAHYIEQGKQDQIIKNLPNDLIAMHAFSITISIGRKYKQGLAFDEQWLEAACNLCWQSITTRGKS